MKFISTFVYIAFFMIIEYLFGFVAAMAINFIILITLSIYIKYFNADEDDYGE